MNDATYNGYSPGYYFVIGLSDDFSTIPKTTINNLELDVDQVQPFDSETKLVMKCARSCIVLKDRPSIEQVMNNDLLLASTVNDLRKRGLGSSHNYRELMRKLVLAANMERSDPDGDRDIVHSYGKPDRFDFMHYSVPGPIF
uniref:Uncharacterized protein n=1 Tax=Aplanochytrium stocchinoi TaxID=215587 RepID=A0A6S8CTW0_9STRA